MFSVKHLFTKSEKIRNKKLNIARKEMKVKNNVLKLIALFNIIQMKPMKKFSGFKKKKIVVFI